MTLKINIEDLNTENISAAELIWLLFLNYKVNNNLLNKKLLDAGLIKKSKLDDVMKGEPEYALTAEGEIFLSKFVTSPDKAITLSLGEDRLKKLAETIIEFFPKGKKEGTNIYWRGNTKDTESRLKKFFRKYGNKYTDHQIVKATKKYVESFNGNYEYMRVLKYFIWKDERKMDSEGRIYVDEVSELASFIENEDIEPQDKDWTSTLI